MRAWGRHFTRVIFNRVGLEYVTIVRSRERLRLIISVNSVGLFERQFYSLKWRKFLFDSHQVRIYWWVVEKKKKGEGGASVIKKFTDGPRQNTKRILFPNVSSYIMYTYITWNMFYVFLFHLCFYLICW